MEKYFIVKDEKLIKDFREYREALKFYKESYTKLMEEFGITTERFLPYDPLQIVATQSDLNKFSSQFTKGVKSSGRKQFKVSSEVGKRWRRLVDGVNSPTYPWLTVYGINGSGIASTINEIDGVVYINIQHDSEKLSVPDTLCEIKGSDYYKIIEEYESREK